MSKEITLDPVQRRLFWVRCQRKAQQWFAEKSVVNSGEEEKERKELLRYRSQNSLDRGATMAATDGQIILAASRFGDSTPTYVR